MQGLQDASAIASRRRFRFAVSLGLLLLLWWFVLDALDREASRVEQLSYDRTLNQLRSALLVKGSEIMLDGKQSYTDVKGANPFDWMNYQFSQYIGDCPEAIPLGKWCFSVDLQKKTLKAQRGRLIYRTKYGLSTQSRDLASGELISWRVQPVGPDNNASDESLDGGGAGLKLQRVTADKPNSRY